MLYLKGVEIMNVGGPIIVSIACLIVTFISMRDNKKLLKLNEGLELQTTYLKGLFENSQDGILILDNKDRIINTNESFQRIFQYKSDEIKGLFVNDVIANSEINDAFEMSNIIIKGGTVNSETNRKRKDGMLVDVRVNAFPLVHDNKQIGLCAIYKDISYKRDSERALELQRIYFRQLFENTPEAICIIDIEDRFINVNAAFEQLFGYLKEELVNCYLNDKIVQNESIKEATKISENVMKGNVIEHETLRMKKDGSLVDVSILGYPIIFEEKQIGVFGIYKDITERKRMERKLEHLSYHDQLTGLYNRRFYEEELSRLDTERNFPITLVMADVNGLKLTNDAFGHKAGDILLVKIANVLKRECRADEIVARIGGDEFVLLLPNTDEKSANKIIERINIAIINEKIDNAILSISMGFAVKQDVSEDMNEVFKKAEDDMYRHKLSESSSMRSKTIDLIMNSLYEKNSREMFHSKRVSKICEDIAIKMDFEKDDINQIRIAGLMHDIGKIGINDTILNKAGKLNSEEWDEIKRHSEIGYRILSSANEFSEIADYVLEHHERWNGKGYPKGLKGEEISLQARIIAVADSYDAMTSNRTYGKALSEEEAISEVRRCSGIQFDPDIVKIFVEKVLEIGRF